MILLTHYFLLRGPTHFPPLTHTVQALEIYALVFLHVYKWAGWEAGLPQQPPAPLPGCFLHPEVTPLPQPQVSPARDFVKLFSRGSGVSFSAVIRYPLLVLMIISNCFQNT